MRKGALIFFFINACATKFCAFKFVYYLGLKLMMFVLRYSLTIKLQYFT